MALNEIQQIKQLIENSKNILIAFRKNGGGDAVGSALALSLFLQKLGKRVDIVCSGFELPKSLKFLKGAEEIKPNFSHLQKFVVTIDVKQTGVKELSYDLKDEKLRIFITPKQGFLTRENVRTAQSDFKYEIIFVLDTPDLEALGPVYDNNTELFHKKPVVNIDHNPANEHFGQLNLVDLTVACTAEIIYNFLEQENIDKDIATALLAGMIISTNSFRSANIKPQTLDTAGRLMALGADREQIVQNLYRTKSLSTLKLWGQVLSHIQHDEKIGLVWASVTRDDFVRSGANQSDLKGIIDELIINSSEAKLILLLCEPKETTAMPEIRGILHSEKQFDALALLKPFSPTGNKKEAHFAIAGKTLKETEEIILQQIKKTLIENV